jgi:hypothetical protein
MGKAGPTCLEKISFLPPKRSLDGVPPVVEGPASEGVRAGHPPTRRLGWGRGFPPMSSAGADAMDDCMTASAPST